jgi:hypothetical protein
MSGPFPVKEKDKITDAENQSTKNGNGAAVRKILSGLIR